MANLAGLAGTCGERDRRELLQMKEKFGTRTEGSLFAPQCFCDEDKVVWLKDEIRDLEDDWNELKRIQGFMHDVQAKVDQDRQMSARRDREADCANVPA